ncbi:MAG: DNA-3-methyladenine glycosylase [Candidatus Binataceae bacterium]
MPPVTVPYARAARMHLARVDPVMAAIIAKVGPCQIVRRRERFRALARAIIFQQLAGAAATAIYGRVVKIYPGRAFPHPTQILATPDAILRKAGLSAKKALYIKDLATHVDKKILSFHRFARMTDEEVIADLTRVKGIGRWTAEMFLMFNLARPDVLPVDDLGVRNAVGRAYSMRKPPTPKELRVFGQRWSPYRTAAAWYLWKSLEIKTPGTVDRKPAPRQHR